MWTYTYCFAFLFPKGVSPELDRVMSTLALTEVEYKRPKMGTHLTIVPPFTATGEMVDALLLGMEIADAKRTKAEQIFAKYKGVRILKEEKECSLVLDFDLPEYYKNFVKRWRTLLLSKGQEGNFTPHITFGEIENEEDLNKKLRELGIMSFPEFDLPLNNISLMKKTTENEMTYWMEIVL